MSHTKGSSLYDHLHDNLKLSVALENVVHNKATVNAQTFLWLIKHHTWTHKLGSRENYTDFQSQRIPEEID